MTTNRRPAGTPVGGQFAPGARLDAGVTLLSPEEPAQLPAPTDLTPADVMKALASESDPLGIGADATTVAGGVQVYYVHDDSDAIGVRETAAGKVQIFDYDADDDDFERPCMTTTFPPAAARSDLVRHVHANERAAALLARASTATQEEIDLIAAEAQDAMAGPDGDVSADARDAYFDAVYDQQLGGLGNIADAQSGRAEQIWGNGPHGLALRDAVWALNMRHLVGDPRVSVSGPTPRGWTQRAYDTMTAPVRQVLGPIHPDDAPMERLRPGWERDIRDEALGSDDDAVYQAAQQLERALVFQDLAAQGAIRVRLRADGDDVVVDEVLLAGGKRAQPGSTAYAAAAELADSGHISADALRRETAGHYDVPVSVVGPVAYTDLEVSEESREAPALARSVRHMLRTAELVQASRKAS